YPEDFSEVRRKIARVGRHCRKSADFWDFRPDFQKVVRKSQKPPGFLQSRREFQKSGTEIHKSRLEITISALLCRKLSGFFKSRLTFSNSGQLRKKADGNLKCGPTLRISVRNFPISIPLFRMRDNFRQSGPENRNFRPDFSKA